MKIVNNNDLKYTRCRDTFIKVLIRGIDRKVKENLEFVGKEKKGRSTHGKKDWRRKNQASSIFKNKVF